MNKRSIYIILLVFFMISSIVGISCMYYFDVFNIYNNNNTYPSYVYFEYRIDGILFHNDILVQYDKNVFDISMNYVEEYFHVSMKLKDHYTFKTSSYYFYINVTSYYANCSLIEKNQTVFSQEFETSLISFDYVRFFEHSLRIELYFRLFQHKKNFLGGSKI